MFAANYPETPHILHHQMADHAALSLDALAELAGVLPASSIEFNSGDLPIGVDGKPDATGLTIQDTIRHIATSNSWAVLKNIEQSPAYENLLLSLLEELKPQIEAKTGAMLRPQGFIFISSPDAVTPYHFDPEHNILLQLKGSKVMTQFPAGDARFAPDQVHEGYHSGGARELTWDDSFAKGGTEFAISAGQALFVPVMAPHFVRNGPTSSISLSITWRSDWSFEEADARGFNRILRKSGITPTAPSRWPGSNKPKAYAYRALRKFGLVG
ncbi:cupin domain-containing protein [Pontixanthobacter aquaemixtae]|uniref:Transcriptional regulator n=1 Tax=Pontixanthobacter aquaemixtae TaxID=1958940 RepID=A0A844ZMS7_9SPHN|nr:cupin-like domain-containing protein [Pontixanthobacter aquaemixtae]MXO89691.1 transcriptional regulator [Pontixanthobacter aquaemixtae]